MSSFKVNIKWGKELYKDIEISTSEPPVVFKAQLFALTNVAPERQKIMFKGQTLGDELWTNIEKHLKDGVTLMMMGSCDPIPQITTQQANAVFLEDLNERQLAQELDLPVGLQNLGNTCYLNAVLQCFKSVPELCKSLDLFKSKKSSGLNDADLQNSLVLSLCTTYEYMDKHKVNGFAPILLVQLLRTILPRFADTAENGVFVQQDANECWTELMRILQQKLPPLVDPSGAVKCKYSNFIDQYFSGEFTSTFKCVECPEEKETQNKEPFLQLSCFISQDVKYLHTGIKLRLEESLTKYSDTLKRDAVYTKISKISRLPAYLCIQNVRFFYKEKDKINAKILKDVKFTLQLDVFELCTPELQQKLIPVREKFRIVDDKNANEARELKKKQLDGQTPMDLEAKSSVSTNNLASFSFEDDAGSNNSGLYELIAVLTHKGRSSNSGHYVGWCKNVKKSQWMMFDDDEVTPVTEEDILKLSGGGDWHTSYLLLYAPRRLDLSCYNEATNLEKK
jgi:ubiquitin carboxyl-terminal hydrolase 14